MISDNSSPNETSENGEKEGPPHMSNGNYPIADHGKRQSPIDIATSTVEYDCNLANKPIQIRYKPEKQMHIVNTGSSVKAEIKEISEISGGPLDGKYRLEQFHFHWGSNSSKGSEHTLNGYTYASELHLVHWNKSKYRSFAEAADKDDGLAVLGFFIKQGKEHKELKQLTDGIKQIYDKDALAKLPDKFDPKRLLPGQLNNYWTYDGSLTTPPYYESVKWIVFSDVIEMSEDQLKELRSTKSCSCGEKYIIDNFRPPLPLGDRQLRSSFKMTNTKCPHACCEIYPIATNGKRQSPVDIATESVVYESNFANRPITINYRPEKRLNITNTGSSVQAAIKEVSEISGGPLVDKYQLEQFHFHWGSDSKRGSEHTLNGYTFSSELHLVHWNKSKYDSFADAADKEDGLAVLGFFIKEGKEHKELKQLTDRIKRIQMRDTQSSIPDKFDPKHILPEQLNNYWTYDGSLTTPPYYESVKWIVFADVIEISEDQLRELRCMKSCSCEGKYIVDNFRPPLPLGDRQLKSSFQMMSTKL